MQSVRTIFQIIKDSINTVKKYPIILVASLVITVLDDLFSTDYGAFKALSSNPTAQQLDTIIKSFLTIQNLAGFIILFISGFVFYNILYQIFALKKVDYKKTITSTLFNNNMYWYTLSFVTLLLSLITIGSLFSGLLYLFTRYIYPMAMINQIYIIICYTFILLMLSYPFVSIALRLAVAEISFKRKWELYFKLFKKDYYVPSLKFYWVKSLLEVPVLGFIALIAYFKIPFVIEFLLLTILFTIVVSIGRTASFDFFMKLYKSDLD